MFIEGRKRLQMSAPLVRSESLSEPIPVRQKRFCLPGTDPLPSPFVGRTMCVDKSALLLPSFSNSNRTLPRQSVGDVPPSGTSSSTSFLPQTLRGQKETSQVALLPRVSRPSVVLSQEKPSRVPSRVTPAFSAGSFVNGDFSRLSAASGTHSPTPLRNFGNTCYLNATMQCILHSPRLLSELRRVPAASKPLAVTSALLKFEKPNSSDIGQLLLTIKSEVAKHNAEFRDNRQSDAHEFLRTFLYVVHLENNLSGGRKSSYEEMEEVKNESEEQAMRRWREYFLRIDNSPVYDLFSGIMRSKCVCSSCGKVSWTFDPFLDLSLSMPSGAQKTMSIESLLELNFDDVGEKLRGCNQLHCAQCKRPRNGTRSVKITSWPKLLVLHLNRFDAAGRKNTTPVVCPESFMTHGGNSTRYRLYGVVCHSGSESWGHYTSYVRVASSGGWFLCNDTQITSTTVAEAMRALTQAYIVFYLVV